MTLAEIVQKLDLTVLTPLPEQDVEITRGYASDLLSDVLGKAQEDAIWVTIQSHPNVIAVASLLNLAAVVVVGGILPEAATLGRAREAGVAVLTTRLSAFELIGRLYQLGVRGDAISCLDG
jgi:hypothetical protein